MFWSLTLTSEPGFHSRVPGSRGGASPPAVLAFSGPGEQQSSDALPGCRGSGPVGPGGRGPWFQRVCLPPLLRQVIILAACGHHWSCTNIEVSSKCQQKTKEGASTCGVNMCWHIDSRHAVVTLRGGINTKLPQNIQHCNKKQYVYVFKKYRIEP